MFAHFLTRRATKPLYYCVCWHFLPVSKKRINPKKRSAKNPRTEPTDHLIAPPPPPPPPPTIDTRARKKTYVLAFAATLTAGYSGFIKYRI
ncbi:MAG: hypothetical protein LBP89_10355 [Helicobacteraceae bacterium]|nr:hypothetical protein [Helicobacteraceae bacterium]